MKLSSSAGDPAMRLLLWFLCSTGIVFTSGSECGPEFDGKCFCGEIMFQEQYEYVVNCTDTAFTDSDVLEYMPEQTQVLIFTGNSIPELPWNVFGTLKDYKKLRVVDMSNNKIREILGKTYHRVSNVERLILNHNEISISAGDDYNYHHPRIFSNFVNLKELHLTNAFADKSKNLASDLHDIFVNSNLTQLIKLHLEQNEISVFKDQKVFCDLPSLMDLHLGDNLLRGVDFEIECLTHLRFIDLENNKFRRLTTKELKSLDSLPERKQNLTIDLSGNPFSCDCTINDLFVWLHSTKVEVRRKDLLRCFHDSSEEEALMRRSDCTAQTAKATVASAQHQATEIVLGLLLVILIALFLGIIYNHRKAIKYRLNPILDSMSRKVYYTSIGHQEEEEVDV